VGHPIHEVRRHETEQSQRHGPPAERPMRACDHTHREIVVDVRLPFYAGSRGAGAHGHRLNEPFSLPKAIDDR
jgi:hypothetical protein